MPFCQNCGAEVGIDEKFCAECGAKIPKQVKKAAATKALYCQNCGTEIESGEKFCAECGARISQQAKKTVAIKAKAPAREAKARGEVMDNCGDGIVFAEPSAPVTKVAQDTKPKRSISLGKRRLMLIAGIVIIAVALAGVYLFAGSVAQTGVPIYPDATEATFQGMTIEEILAEVGQTMPSGWSAKMYQTTATAGELTYWYRNNMPGWTKIYDNIMSEPGVDFSMDILGFIRNKDGAFIISMSVLDVHYFIIMEGPAEDMQDLIEGNI